MSSFLFSLSRHASRRSLWIRASTRALATAEASVAAQSQELPVYASCVLARAPLVKPQLEDWEIEYKTWAAKIQAQKQRALPSGWQKTKKTTVEDEEGGDGKDAESGQEWDAVPRVTEADRTGDVKSLMRCLDRYLYFVVKAASGTWSFPSADNRGGETIRQTGERALAQSVTPGADVFFIANWPIAHYVFREDPAVPRVEYYMKAQLLSGGVTLLEDDTRRDYAWIAKSEIAQYFSHDPKLAQLLSKALV